MAWAHRRRRADRCRSGSRPVTLPAVEAPLRTRAGGVGRRRARWPPGYARVPARRSRCPAPTGGSGADRGGAGVPPTARAAAIKGAKHVAQRALVDEVDLRSHPVDAEADRVAPDLPVRSSTSSTVTRLAIAAVPHLCQASVRRPPGCRQQQRCGGCAVPTTHAVRRRRQMSAGGPPGWTLGSDGRWGCPRPPSTEPPSWSSGLPSGWWGAGQAARRQAGCRGAAEAAGGQGAAASRAGRPSAVGAPTPTGGVPRGGNRPQLSCQAGPHGEGEVEGLIEVGQGRCRRGGWRRWFEDGDVGDVDRHWPVDDQMASAGISSGRVGRTVPRRRCRRSDARRPGRR